MGLASGSGIGGPQFLAAGGDLLALGATKSLARPGGNITGLSNLTIDYLPKLPELLLAARATALARDRVVESVPTESHSALQPMATRQ